MSKNHTPANVIPLHTAVLYGVILVLGQLLLTQWTIRAAGQRDIIDFVSFSGTVTSMLLAVLAIVYSYFTTASQKGDADRIAMQIASLSTTISSLDSTENRFTDELTRLSEIRAQLDLVGERVNQSAQLSEQTHQAVAELKAQRTQAVQLKAQGNETRAAAGTRGEDYSAAIERMVCSAVPIQAPAFLTAYELLLLPAGSSLADAVSQHAQPYFSSERDLVGGIAATTGEVFTIAMAMLDLGFKQSESARRAYERGLAQLLEKVREHTDGGTTYDWAKFRPVAEAQVEKLRALTERPKPEAS